MVHSVQDALPRKELRPTGPEGAYARYPRGTLGEYSKLYSSDGLLVVSCANHTSTGSAPGPSRNCLCAFMASKRWCILDLARGFSETMVSTRS